MTTEMQTASHSGQDVTIEEKINQLRELFPNPPCDALDLHALKGGQQAIKIRNEDRQRSGQEVSKRRKCQRGHPKRWRSEGPFLNREGAF